MQQEKIYAILAEGGGIVAIGNDLGEVHACVFLELSTAEKMFKTVTEMSEVLNDASPTIVRLVEFAKPRTLETFITGDPTSA